MWGRKDTVACASPSGTSSLSPRLRRAPLVRGCEASALMPSRACVAGVRSGSSTSCTPRGGLPYLPPPPYAELVSPYPPRGCWYPLAPPFVPWPRPDAPCRSCSALDSRSSTVCRHDMVPGGLAWCHHRHTIKLNYLNLTPPSKAQCKPCVAAAEMQQPPTTCSDLANAANQSPRTRPGAPRPGTAT